MDNKEMLIEMFETADRGRRRFLMNMFYDTITMKISDRFICQLINKELDRPGMVTSKDLVYCRFHFGKKTNTVQTQMASPSIPKKSPKTETPSSVDDGKVSWSDPDETDFKKQLTKTTKFSRQ